MKHIVLLTIITLFILIETEAMELGKYGNFKFKNVNANVYVMHGPVMEPNIDNEGFMNNPTIIEGKTGLIIVDPGGNYNIGKKILSEIEKISKKPILATLNTHKHGDHWFANKALLEKYPKLKIYAHPNMIKEVKNGEAQKWYDILNRLTKNLKGTDQEFPYPNQILKDGQKLMIDSEKFVIMHPKKAHTDTDLVIIHLNSRTLFLGDNVMKGRFGNFDESSSILGNIALLEKLKTEDTLRYYIPGHGHSGKRDETIDPFLNYLKSVKKWAQKAYDDDLETYEIKSQVIKELQEYKDWDKFEYRLGRHLMKAYDEIAMADEE